jgi:glutamyl endopeptidase
MTGSYELDRVPGSSLPGGIPVASGTILRTAGDPAEIACNVTGSRLADRRVSGVPRRRTSMAGTLLLTVICSLALVGCVDPADPLAPDVLVFQDGTIMQPAAPGSAPVGGRRGHRGYAPEGFGIESVIGIDDRAPVRMDTYPGRAVGTLTRYGAPFCTAFLVGADLVLTAGHCVHDGGLGAQWVEGLRFSPGREGFVERHGSCSPAPNGLATLQGFARDADERYDVGIIHLDCRIGEQVGWFGLLWTVLPLALGHPVTMQGYAADLPAHTQWGAQGLGLAADATLLFHDADTGVGMSGSVLWQDGSPASPCEICAIAVHAYGLHGDGMHAQANHGIRVTERLVNLIETLAARSSSPVILPVGGVS